MSKWIKWAFEMTWEFICLGTNGWYYYPLTVFFAPLVLVLLLLLSMIAYLLSSMKK